MYIESIEITNVKLLRDVRLDFKAKNGSVRMWTMLVGDNGLCKTTLLQSIGLAAAGVARANQLANVPSYPDRRQDSSEAEISATLQAGFALDGPQGARPEAPAGSTTPMRYESHLSVAPPDQIFHGGSRVLGQRLSLSKNPVSEAQTREGSGWFILGYGVGRNLPEPGIAEMQEQLTLARLAPLFRTDAPILATGFSDILDKNLARSFASLLREALVKSGLLPRTSSLELRGRGGANSAAALLESHRFELSFGKTSVRLPGVWLSQGYQAMIAWVADLVGQAVWHAQGRVELANIEGLVLIDEIDLFVHPRWQVKLIATLRAVFPRVQFIATTHSPMVLAGLRRDELYLLTQTDTGDVELEAAPAAPRLMTGSELYAAFFDVTETYPAELRERVRHYAKLANDPGRSVRDQQTLTRLRHELEEEEGIDLGFKPVPRNGDLPR